MSRHRIERFSEQTTSDSSSSDFLGENGVANRTNRSKRHSIRKFSKKAKEKTKEILHVDGRETPSQKSSLENEESDGLGIVESDAAFNPKLLNEQKQDRTEVPGRNARRAMKSISAVIRNPKESLKTAVTKATAARLSKTERPYISQASDLELLEAHQKLDQTSSTRASNQWMSNEESPDDEAISADKYRSKVEEIEAHRESLRVAWMTSRHISRVHVIPQSRIVFPHMPKSYFKAQDQAMARYEWLSWLGHILLYYAQDFSMQYVGDFDELPFDIDSLKNHVERLVVASAPWQSWAMDVRSVYRWENPWITGKWLALYLVLWYTEHMMGFLYFYIIYIVIRNHFFPMPIQSLQDSMQRALDDKAKAYRISELIDKHGRKSWLEPLIDDLGPYVLLQVGDLANLLETFDNFYNWKRPEKTLASLCFILVCLLLTIFTDMQYCMKILWFVVGGSFFLCWPIASWYPKYRYLVSSFKWVLWDVPTHSELSFQHLQRLAQITRKQMIGEKAYCTSVRNSQISIPETHETSTASASSNKVPKIEIDSDSEKDDDWHSISSVTSLLDASDIKAFRALWQGSFGRLVIFSSGLKFIQSLTKRELWNRPFSELIEIRKLRGSSISKVAMGSAEQLELQFVDKSVLLLEGMKDRDEAFNIIIGFSGLRWQALQPVDNKATKKEN